MEKRIRECDVPYWEEPQRKIAVEYCDLIVRTAEKKLGLSWNEAALAVIKSGVCDIAHGDPEVSSHRDPEEWMENLETYLKKKENSV